MDWHALPAPRARLPREFFGVEPVPPRGWHLYDSSRRGKINRNLEDQHGVTFYKAGSGRSCGSGVTNDLALHEIDYQFGDVGGMIGHPFEVFGNEAQANGT